MARKKSKLNFLDSLLGGLAQGFQLSQQFKGDKQKSELDERKLSIQEQKLDLQQQQFDLDQEQRNKFQFLFGGGGQAPNRLPALNAPSPIVPAPSTFEPIQPTPSPTTAAAPAPAGIAKFPTELPAGGRVAPALPAAPIVQPGPAQIPFDTETFAQPTQAPQAPEVSAPEQPADDQARLASITDFIQQLEGSLANPGLPTTVTANFGTAGSVSKVFGKGATPDQHFSHFIQQMKERFPTATPADLSGFLQNSTLRDTDAAQKFFNRSFNSAVNREFRFLLSQETGRVSTSKRNDLQAEAVAETVKNFNGFVSKRHQKQFQPETDDVDAFELSEAVQAELNLVFKTPEDFARAMQKDPKGTATLLEKAISKVQQRKVETAAAQGVGVIEAKIEAGLKLPVDPNDLVKLINPKTFAPFKAGTTWQEIKDANGIAVTAGQRTALANINSSLDNVRIITELGKTLFVNDSLIDRIIEAGPNAVERVRQTNPDAIVYEDTVTAVTRTIARAFGEARITDFDAEDFRKSFPKLLPGRGETFIIPDSKALADKKLSQLARIIDNSRRRIIGLPPITNTALTAEEKAELERLEKELGR